MKPTLVLVLIPPDLRDDLKHGVVLWDPEQSGVLKQWAASLLVMREGQPCSVCLILFLFLL